VITGIGLIASVGMDREAVWTAVQAGSSGVRRVTRADGIPSGLKIAALVDLPGPDTRRLKVVELAHRAAAEAIEDAGLDLEVIDRQRVGCAVSGHMGDTRWLEERARTGRDPQGLSWDHWLPNSGCASIAERFGLWGPRICHSTACASGLIDFLCAVRSIQCGQCDVALAGSAEAIHPLFAAGFRSMRVLADDRVPARACRPFDRSRQGFVMGEGAAMFILERLDHALARRCPIYAEVPGGRMLADAHHVTGLDTDSDSLGYLISDILRRIHLTPSDVHYINAHGTGTRQNDLLEIRGIRQALGAAADNVCISSTKSMLGHLVNAAGSVELAITALAMRDGFAPPTLNLTDPDPECDLDCLPLVGRPYRFQNALKLSIAFGGHLVAVALRRWNDAATGFAYPERRKAA
jgi:3-oxoacyl-(acyl-carrier-protein) synthase